MTVVHFLLRCFFGGAARHDRRSKGLRKEYKSIQTQWPHRLPQPSDTFNFSVRAILLSVFRAVYSRRHELIRPLSRARIYNKNNGRNYENSFFSYSPFACLQRRARAAKSVYIRMIFLRDLNWSRRIADHHLAEQLSRLRMDHHRLDHVHIINSGALFAHSCSVQFSSTLSSESRCVFSESIRLRRTRGENWKLAFDSTVKNIFLS